MVSSCLGVRLFFYDYPKCLSEETGSVGMVRENETKYRNALLGITYRQLIDQRS
jgi:hypothetical protein